MSTNFDGFLGCGGALIKLCVVLVLTYGVYKWVFPAPSPMHTFYLVHADEQTYLEFENELITDPIGISFGGQPETPRAPFYITKVYYTKVGGWFNPNRRLYLTQVETGDKELLLSRQCFGPKKDGRVDSLYVKLANRWFTPPQHFPADSVVAVDWSGQGYGTKRSADQ